MDILKELGNEALFWQEIQNGLSQGSRKYYEDHDHGETKKGVPITIYELLNKRLVTPARELTTDKNKDTTLVKLSEPISLLELLTGIGMRGGLKKQK